ncbi:MAG: OsmC family protein [Actinomycetota bacterium]|nr:OsmC family protein [Actinomycetota bacterium]
MIWEGSKEDLRAHRIELSAQTVLASSMPERGGNAERADPEEMFVASLASCHMLWFLRLARERRLRVLSYEDEAIGELDGERITGVELHPRVTFEAEPEGYAVTDLHHAAHECCFLARSVNFPVEVSRP